MAVPYGGPAGVSRGAGLEHFSATWIRSPSRWRYRTKRADAETNLAAVLLHDRHEGLRVAFELRLSDAVNLPEGAPRERALRRHVDQRTVGEDHVGRHALLLGEP